MDSRNVCPLGWHVPTDSDWNRMIKFLDVTADTSCSGCYQSTVAGGAIKSRGLQFWQSPNSNATNISGFSALPAGGTSGPDLAVAVGYSGCWWSSTMSSSNNAFSRRIVYDNAVIAKEQSFANRGLSIRCLRD
jgi:uncharacterized protein (TIGR02145 family)